MLDKERRKEGRRSGERRNEILGKGYEAKDRRTDNRRKGIRRAKEAITDPQ